MTVNRERVQLLVDALRSGRFEQGRGALLRNGKYCCLGVACVVAQEAGLKLRMHEEDGDVSFGNPDNWDSDQSSGELPLMVTDWYGFDDNDPDLTNEHDKHHRRTAAAWNDDSYTFAWIADAFERTYLAAGNNT
jgi:hypothetical protein